MSIQEYYVAETDDDEPDGPYDNYLDAKHHAQTIKGQVVCYEYEFSDSYMVDDYTEGEDDDDDSDVSTE